MNELIKKVEILVCDELTRANEINKDKFNSLHEGHGVIMEELQEAQEEFDKADKKLIGLWNCIRKDNTAGALECAQQVKNRAILAACEAVQTAAMAIKFIESYK